MTPLTVVSGVCAGDAQVLERTLDWCAELGPQPADLVVITEGDMPNRWNAGGFLSLRIITAPPLPTDGRFPWMAAPMQHHRIVRSEYPGRPYFMLEPDVIPLTSGWVRGLIEGHGPDFLNTMSGNWVVHSSDSAGPFLNGVALYPARYQVPEVPSSVIYGVDRTNNRTFHPDLRFVENERLVHIWGDEEGSCVPINGSKVPTFPIPEALSALCRRYPRAVLFHRCKDGSLIERLKEPPPPMFRDDLPHLFTRLGFKVGVEIGVAVGQFSETILSRWDGRLHLVDGWDGPFPAWPVPQDGLARMEATRQRTARWSDRVTLHRAWSPAAASLFEDRSLDWFYLDANHGYAPVLADLNAWYPKLRSGGVVSGHDYLDSFEAHNKPMQVPDSQRHLLSDYGVLSAVREFRRQQCITAPLHVTAEPVEHVPSFWWTKP